MVVFFSLNIGAENVLSFIILHFYLQDINSGL